MPVKVTEQLVIPDVVERVHALDDSKPPVVPAVSVKVTVPVGALVAVVVSATVALTLAVQLVAPRAMLQLTFGTVVSVASFAEVVTVTVAAALLLVLWVPSPP